MEEAETVEERLEGSRALGLAEEGWVDDWVTEVRPVERQGSGQHPSEVGTRSRGVDRRRA